METSSVSLKKAKASRYTGVFRAGKKWKAQLQNAGVQHYLGIFDTEEDASAAYEAFKGSQQSGGGAKATEAARSIQKRVKKPKPPVQVVEDPEEAGTGTGTAAEAELEPPAPFYQQMAFPYHTDSLLQYAVPGELPLMLLLPAEREEELRMKLRVGELYLNL